MTKRLTIDLHADEMIALRRAAHEMRVDGDVEVFAAQLLRDAMIAGGWLEDGYGLDEATEMRGKA